MGKTPLLSYGYATDVGLNPVRVAKGNQDYYGLDGPVRTTDTGEEVYLFVVADGMGGHAYGADASRRAVKVIVERFRAVPPAGDLQLWVKGAVEAAHAAVLADGRDDPPQEHRGTTVVALVVKGAEAVIGHVGDSPAFLIRQGVATRVTRPHVVGRALAQAVGHSDSLYVETQQLALGGGDVIVLATDGVTNEVQQRELPGLVRAEPGLAANNLIAVAKKRGGHDNATAVVVRVGGAPAKGRRWLRSPKAFFLGLAAIAAAAVLVVVGVYLFKGPGGKGETVSATAATAQPLLPETAPGLRKQKREPRPEAETRVTPAALKTARDLQKTLESLSRRAETTRAALAKTGLAGDARDAAKLRDTADDDLKAVNAILTGGKVEPVDEKNLAAIGKRAGDADLKLKALEAKAASPPKKPATATPAPKAETPSGGVAPEPGTTPGAETPGTESGGKVGPDESKGESGDAQPLSDNPQPGGP